MATANGHSQAAAKIGFTAYIDGFDDYAATSSTTAGWTANFSASIAGRVSGNAARLGSNATDRNHPLTANGRYTVGLAIRMDDFQGTTSFLRLREGTTEHAVLRKNTNGTISYLRGTTALATSVTAIGASVWHYIEVDAIISNTVGEYEVRLDGATIIGRTTGADTQNAGTGFIDTISLNSSNSLNFDSDDLYCNGGATNFWGDGKVISRLPIADGANTSWSLSTGSSHFELVDETTSNGGTDYIYSNTVGQIDTFTYDPINSVGSLKALQVVLSARKNDAGSRQISTVVRRSGTNYAGPPKILTASYVSYTQAYDLDPSTISEWTISNADGAEFGVKVEA